MSHGVVVETIYENFILIVKHFSKVLLLFSPISNSTSLNQCNAEITLLYQTLPVVRHGDYNVGWAGNIW